MNFSLSGVLTPLRKRKPSERSKYPQFLLGVIPCYNSTHEPETEIDQISR